MYRKLAPFGQEGVQEEESGASFCTLQLSHICINLFQRLFLIPMNLRFDLLCMYRVRTVLKSP